MIQESFVLLDKVGQKTEKRLWQQGIDTWDKFQGVKHIPSISAVRKGHYDRQLHDAERALYNLNTSFFVDALPQSETWRLFDFFKDEAVYLDIETSGYYGDITVIGMSDGVDAMTLVQGQNLEKRMLAKLLNQYKVIVTFNGSSFDLPVINRYFQGVIPHIPHIDLRHVCRKIGLVGGLKSIERQIGITRSTMTQQLSGADAVYLWQMWKSTGEREYLELLVQYNEEDILNLKPLAEHAISRLWSATRHVGESKGI